MERFKIGEKVVCINNAEASLTLHKTYIVDICKGKAYDNMGVRDDSGSVVIYAWRRFVSLKEFRKQKLQKIENNESD